MKTTALDNIETITLFVDDIIIARSFYARAFGGSTVFEDDVCTVIRLEGAMINLLKASEAEELLSPLSPAPADTRPRMMLTIKVSDVDRVCDDLKQAGVVLLNGPIDRPWGRRTAAFLDPAGHAWEIAQDLVTAS